MNVLHNWVQTSLAKALGWTLIHSLWEGALAALMLVLALALIRSSRLRYAAACAALLGTLAGFGVTLSCLLPAGAGASTLREVPNPRLPDDGQPMRVRQSIFDAADALPWLAPLWLAGVILFHLRRLASWMAARRLRRRGVCAAPDEWQQRLGRLRDRLRMSASVMLLESCLADVPVVIGYLRPVILVPVGMLTGMPASQIDAILLHELAHIRRGDYLVNLLQTVVEGFLFYHPAVWWISRVIRNERENCCDDVAVAASGNAYEYAAALTALEHNRRTANDAVLAANGGNLMQRVRRLLYPLEVPRVVLAPLFSAFLLAATAALALTAWQASAQQETAPPAAENAYSKWVKEDVAYIISEEERAAFKRLTTDGEREHFIEQFWLRRDPTPGTPANEFKEEHYRRIAYANNRFSTQKVEGWRTDRGRIYIVYGPPDEIESHPAGGGQVSPYPYEQWLYHHIEGVADNVIMDFVDQTQTGDYRMTSDPNRNP